MTSILFRPQYLNSYWPGWLLHVQRMYEPIGIVSIGHPVSGWRDVIVLKAAARNHKQGQVMLEHVADLNAILQKESAAFDVVDHVVFNSDVMCAMHIDGPVETAMDGTAANIWEWRLPMEMEMDGVTSQTEGLPHIGQLHIGEATNHQILVRTDWLHDDLGTKLITAYLLSKTSLEASLRGKFTYTGVIKEHRLSIRSSEIIRLLLIEFDLELKVGYCLIM